MHCGIKKKFQIKQLQEKKLFDDLLKMGVFVLTTKTRYKTYSFEIYLCK